MIRRAPNLTVACALILMALLTLFVPMIRPALSAEDDPAAEVLKKQAQDSFLAGRYADAAAKNLEIAKNHPDSEARRYAVQMLGTIYENSLTDLNKAIRWHREFLERYAGPGQVPFYREKLATLEKLREQEEAFATYQKIRFGNHGDEEMVRRLEALLARHPDFTLKEEVQRELGYAYARLDKRRESAEAFRNLSSAAGARFSADDRIALENADRHWQATGVWGGAAWGVVALFWGAVLALKPWRGIDRRSLKTFLVLAVVWLALAALRLPSFHAIDTSGDEFAFTEGAVYLAALANLPVLFWTLLLSRARVWQGCETALRLAAPVLALALTAAVHYLFLIHQPNGAKIMDAFGAKYRHWGEELSGGMKEKPALTPGGAPGNNE